LGYNQIKIFSVAEQLKRGVRSLSVLKAGKVSLPFAGIFIKILVFAVLVAVTALAIRPLHSGLLNRMEQGRDNFFSRMEAYWGRRILYSSLGPSVFGVLDVRDVLILRDDDSVLLSISRLRLSYSLFSLLRGNFFDTFHSVRLDQPVLSLDIERDADILERLASGNVLNGLNGRNGQNGRSRRATSSLVYQATYSPYGYSPARINIENLRELLPEGFSLRIWDGKWDISGNWGNFALQGLELEASMCRERFIFQGGWNASAAANGEIGLGAAMSARISGEYLHDSEKGIVTLVIPSFGGDHFRVNPLTFTFLLSDGIFEGQKTHSESQAAAWIVYNLETGSFSGNFQGENFPLSDILRLYGNWAESVSAPGLMISGDVSIEMERSASPVYSINLSGFRPAAAPEDEVALFVDLWGNGNDVTIGTLELQSPNGNVSFRGGINLQETAPYGVLSLANFSRQPNVPGITGNFALGAWGREITLSGVNLTAGAAALSMLDASLYREEAGFAFSLSARDEQGGAMFIQGSVDNSPRQMRTTLLMDSFPAGNIFSFVEPVMPLPDMPALARAAAADLYVSAEFFLAAYDQHILYNVPSLAVSHPGRPDDILLAASFSGTERRFDLSSGRLSWQGETTDIFASADFSNPDDISFSLSATYRDLIYYISGAITDRRSINAAGSYGFTLNVNGAEDGTRYGYAQAENIPFASGNGLAMLSFLVSLQQDQDTPDSWEAAIERFEISGLATPASSSASLRLIGAANESGLSIPSIVFNDGRGALEGGLSVDWSLLHSYLTFRADIHGNNLSELYMLRGTLNDDRLDIDFSGFGMQLARVSPHNAVADASFRLSWESLNSFEAEAELSSLMLRRGNETLTASVSASMDSETFMLRNMIVSYSGLQASVPSFTVDRASSLAETQGIVQGHLYNRLVDIDFHGQTVFSAAQSWADVFRGPDFIEGFLTFDTARYYTLEADEPFSFEFASVRQDEGFAVSVSGGPRNMLRFNYSPVAPYPGGLHDLGGGTFFAALSSPSPIRGSVAGSIIGNTIDAHTPDLYVDLEAFWRFMPPNTPVAFPAGFLSGSVRIAGLLSDPGFYGTMRGTGVHIVVPDFIPQPIRPAPVTFVMSGSDMTFGPVDADVDRGGGEASAHFVFERWIPGTFTIDIQVPYETPIPYGFDIEGLLANGLASGRLILGHEGNVLTVTGALTAHNTEISLDSEGIFMEGTPLGIFAGPFGFGTASASSNQDRNDGDGENIIDLSIRSGRRVEFFWPSVGFPILQATADMGSVIHITSDSASGTFSLTGDVDLRSGEIFYLDRNFYIREGTLFFNENETNFDPMLTARAEMREVADIGPVTISMIIENEPLMTFTPRFESNPPLSPIEVFSILGQVPPEGEGPRGTGASIALDTLAQFTVMRRIQRQARDFLGLDMLSIRTQAINNIVMQGTGGNQHGDTDLDTERSHRFGNYFDNTTVFMGRYFGGSIFAQAMFTARYDEHRIATGGVLLEPEIGFEMRNPLFDIRFNMSPLHPENWFMDDISISLLWRRTF